MNEFLELYNEIAENEGNEVAFTELEYFLKEFTQQLTSFEAFILVKALMSEEELMDYLYEK